MPQKYAILSRGSDKLKLDHALSLATSIAEIHGCSLTIVTPKLDLKNSILNSILGRKFLDSLVKGKSNTTLEGISVSLYSRRAYSGYGNNGVVLGLWGGIEMLNTISLSNEAKAIIALSWREEDLDSWVKDSSVKIV